MYDAVGNRQQLLVNGVTANAYTYDPDDRLGSDGYDADGNTVNSLGTANTYDFENHLITHGGVTITYDGDGNRVSEVVGGLTTNYLVDTANPTGYAQVVDELQSGTVARTYSYGLERISEKQAAGTSFYGYDGHGSVRQLTNSAGTVTDTYDYDAFGNLVNSTGSTPNNFLFSGEQYDPALNLYYNRARYLNTATGRFWSMDTHQGSDRDPLSLHKYFFAESDPIDHVDPSGNQIDDLIAGLGLSDTLNTVSTPSPTLITTVKKTIPYNVVVVTSPTATYEPTSKVKNSAQAVVSGWPVGTPIRIAVPPGIDPQTTVNQWSSGSIWSARSALNPGTWSAFKKFWSDPANDYKKAYGAIFDAYGNFEFGATGAAAFFGLPALQAAADSLHGGTNDPINTADIQSGYDAIQKGGKLSTTPEKLAP